MLMPEKMEIAEPKEAPTDDKTLVNIVSKIPEDKQKEIAGQIIEDYDNDLTSRSDWEKKRNDYYKLWVCHREKKTTPWEGASNVCIPMMATACNQFHSRSYQAIFNAPGMVKALPVGYNDISRAKDVEYYMNWQILNELLEYEEEFDRLLQILPINGLGYKKLYYSKSLGRPVSENIDALDLVLPYRTKRFENARRLVHRTWLHYDELLDRNEQGLYENFDKVQEVPQAKDTSELKQTADKAAGEEPAKEEDNPHLILECHKKIDIGDGRKPYIFTVDYDSETILRVAGRELDVSGETKILDYFIDYHFIPNPESGVYSFGFGHFIEPMNEMANTAFNQIFDAGSLSNMPFGFYGRRAGIKKRQIKLHPGLMQEVEDATQVYFPSMQRVDQVLFQVIGMIQQYVEQFTSTSDYLMGRESKGTKTPTAHGTLAIIEQGLVTFAVMTKRIFRSLRKELRLLMAINNTFLPETGVQYVMEDEKTRVIKREMFNSVRDVVPIADPSFASRDQRRREAMEIYGALMVNPIIAGNPDLGMKPHIKGIHAITSDLLETYDKNNPKRYLPELPEESLSPEMENAKFMQGDYTDPKPGEDHQNHLETHLVFSQTDFFRNMPPDYRAMLKKHVQATQGVAYADSQQVQQLGGRGEAPMQGRPGGVQQGVRGGAVEG
uniref:Putative co-chaperone GroES n=1 Tax=viral metagenome TaxID=1070528 RepID=A0A6M3XTC8_9ZZZZ